MVLEGIWEAKEGEISTLTLSLVGFDTGWLSLHVAPDTTPAPLVASSNQLIVNHASRPACGAFASSEPGRYKCCCSAPYCAGVTHEERTGRCTPFARAICFLEKDAHDAPMIAKSACAPEATGMQSVTVLLSQRHATTRPGQRPSDCFSLDGLDLGRAFAILRKVVVSRMPQAERMEIQGLAGCAAAGFSMVLLLLVDGFWQLPPPVMGYRDEYGKPLVYL